MENIKYYLKEHLVIVISIIFLMLGLTIICFVIFKDVNKVSIKEKSIALVEKKEKNVKKESAEEKLPIKVRVDIKGAVMNPGVYELDENQIINDVINLAGGLSKNGTTKNINLSRKVKDEMAIIIYTTTELDNMNKISDDCNTDSIYIDECYQEKKSIVDSKASIKSNTSLNTKETTDNSTININLASKEELMTLSGIGEAKALNIIKYREENGGFKAIEELKNISGIGEAIFAKIKDNITI